MTWKSSAGGAKFVVPQKKSVKTGRAETGMPPDPVIEAYKRDLDRTLLRGKKRGG